MPSPAVKGTTSSVTVPLDPVDLPQIAGEQRAEAGERVDAARGPDAEGRQLAGEVAREDVEDPRGDQLRLGLLAGRHVAGQTRV